MADLRNDLDEIVGPPVEVNDRVLSACRERNEFGGLVFELYKEAARLICAVGDTQHTVETRNQAVCVGLLVRISKLMVSVMKLSTDVEHGEAVQILNRCVLESSIDLQYLLKRGDDAVYDRFVKTGLRVERELYDTIHSNIRKRSGRELHIERNMLRSIKRTLDESGVRIEEIASRGGNWGGSFKDKLKTLGIEDAYPMLQGATSQSVHGSWSDLISNHLDAKETGYEPRYHHLTTDGKLLYPMALAATNAAKEYLDRFFDQAHVEFLSNRITDLQERLLKAETARPDWEPTTDTGEV